MWTTELGLKPCKQWRLNMIKPTEKNVDITDQQVFFLIQPKLGILQV
jgi:hypothetical protein